MVFSWQLYMHQDTLITSGLGGEVPEPAGLALAALGALGLIRRTRRA